MLSGFDCYGRSLLRMVQEHAYPGRGRCGHDGDHDQRTTADSPLLTSLCFVRRRSLLLLLISLAVLVPCVWQKHIEAGDLGSHVYNAWLVQLIHQGRAPGLWVENIWQNIFFDTLLSHLASLRSEERRVGKEC